MLLVRTDEQQGDDVGELAVAGEEGVRTDLLPQGRLPGRRFVHRAAFHAAGKDPRLFHVLVRSVVVRCRVLLGTEFWVGMDATKRGGERESST